MLVHPDKCKHPQAKEAFGGILVGQNMGLFVNYLSLCESPMAYRESFPKHFSTFINRNLRELVTMLGTILNYVYFLISTLFFSFLIKNFIAYNSFWLFFVPVFVVNTIKRRKKWFFPGWFCCWMRDCFSYTSVGFANYMLLFTDAGCYLRVVSFMLRFLSCVKLMNQILTNPNLKEFCVLNIIE